MQGFSKKAKYRLSTLALSILCSNSMASDFNLPFVNAAELGNAYAGWAATATDASTAYTNPAGLVRINNQQLVASAVGVTGTTTFYGTTGTPVTSQTGRAQGTLGGFLPLLYYASPINNNVVFGVGVNAPFGLGTNYSKTSIVRYLATRSQIVAVDIGPSVGVKINNKFSLGAGLDFERLSLTLNSMVGPPLSVPDATSNNHVSGWGYGFHAGGLYQFNDATRAGLSYNSQVMFHLHGYSEIYSVTTGNFRSRQRVNTPLPSYAQASIYHDFNSRWTGMASMFYTRWSTINQITLKKTMLPGGIPISVTVPFEYHDTVDYAIGGNYKPSDKWIVRMGVEYYNTPSNNRDRIVADPIGKMVLLAIGGHYQQNRCLGYDVGYAHDFFRQTSINTNNGLTFASGHNKTASDILGGQITWDIL